MKSSDACSHSHSPFPFSPSVLSFYVARAHLTAQASVNTGSCRLILQRAPIITIMQKKISVYSLQERKKGVPTEDYKLMRTLASSPPPFAPFYFFAPLSRPTYSPSFSKTTCTFFYAPSPVFYSHNFFSGGVSWREGCTSGARKGKRRGRDLHEERGGGERRRRRRRKRGAERGPKL